MSIINKGKRYQGFVTGSREIFIDWAAVEMLAIEIEVSPVPRDDLDKRFPLGVKTENCRYHVSIYLKSGQTHTFSTYIENTAREISDGWLYWLGMEDSPEEQSP